MWSMATEALHLIPGLLIAHAVDFTAQTGCTVVLCPMGAVDVRPCAAARRRRIAWHERRLAGTIAAEQYHSFRHSRQFTCRSLLMESSLVLMGPDRAGKRTVGKLLAEHLGRPFHEVSEL